LVLGVGGQGVKSDEKALGNDTDFSPHWGAGLKYYATSWLAMRLDGRMTIGSKLGDEGVVGHYEILAGLSAVLGWKEKEAPKDSDGDGLIDDQDQCPLEKGAPPTGCPPKDSDGDGLTDDQDQCPTEKGNPPTGCPPKDTDGDSLTDDQDQCPTEKGLPPTGCPPRDTDGDGFTDDKDQCPKEPETKNGYKDEDGCPDEIPTEIKKFTGAIKGITFETNKTVIRKQSFPTLDEAVKVLQDYPDLKIKVRGHTDNTGKREKNMTLSQGRAEAVKEYLVGKGVASDKIQTEGLGPDEPVADNKTAKGRTENRRIEFKIIISN
jgi:outer membrane protein OmpA-like peptidoglycan-associated protein